MDRKGAIEKAFGLAAETYSRHAILQKKVALELCRRFAPFPKGDWLEVGSGTGFLTKELLSYSPSKLYVNDISLEMLKSLPKDPRLHPLKGDGEEMEFAEVSLIASSFTLQWFDDPLGAIEKWKKKAKKVVIAIPLAPSFEEWRSVALEEGIPYTLNHLLNPEEFKMHPNFSISYYPLNFSSKWDFLSWFKGMGANVNLGGERIPFSLLKTLKGDKKPFETGISVGFLEA